MFIFNLKVQPPHFVERFLSLDKVRQLSRNIIKLHVFHIMGIWKVCVVTFNPALIVNNWTFQEWCFHVSNWYDQLLPCILILSMEQTLLSSCSLSTLWPWRRSLPEDLLWTGSTMCADGRNWPGWVRLPGKMSALLCACVWLRRQVLRKPLWSLPHRLSGEETDLCGAQQGLLLQRYHLTVVLLLWHCRGLLHTEEKI